LSRETAARFTGARHARVDTASCDFAIRATGCGPPSRMQADENLDVIRIGMGAILDPSNRNGLTSKLIIDATRPGGHFPERHTLDEAAVAKARELIGRHSP
jgi:hypothetical protein